MQKERRFYGVHGTAVRFHGGQLRTEGAGILHGVRHRHFFRNFPERDGNIAFPRAFHGVPGHIHAQFGHQGRLGFVGQLVAAVLATITPVTGVTGGYTGLQLQPPMVTQPPGIAAEKAEAHKIALQALVAGFGIQAQRKGHFAHIEVGIDQIGPKEQALIHPARVETDFRNNGEIAPVAGIVDVVGVPEQPAGPALEPGIQTQG